MKNLPWDFKISKIFYVLLIFVGVLFLFASNAGAQERGTYKCTWIPEVTGGYGGFCYAQPSEIDCAIGHQPPTNPCRFFSELGCESPHLCDPSPRDTNCEEFNDSNMDCRLQNSERPYTCRAESTLYCCTSQEACKSTTKPADCPIQYPIPVGDRCCEWDPSGQCRRSVPKGNYCEFGVYDESLRKCVPRAEIPPPTGPEPCDGEFGTGIQTALGCIPTEDANSFAAWFLRWAIGIAGGIAFLLIVVSSFQIMTAAGNPERLQGGRELLTAAISGLILIIFSVFLLQLIGVQILKIPGL